MEELTIENITPDEISSIIKKNYDKDYETFKKYFDGDHWQDGSGWVGPKPSLALLSDNPQATQIIQEFNTRVKRQFTSKNVVSEVVTRHINGVLSRKSNLQVGFVDESEDNREESEEIETAVWDWITSKKVMKKLRDLLKEVLLGNRAILRIFIPQSLVSDEGLVQLDATELSEALKNIYVDVVEPNKGYIYQDPFSMKRYGLFSMTTDEGDKYHEVTYLDEIGNTIIRTFQDDGDEFDESDGYMLDGNLFMFQVERSALINDQIKQNQNLLSKNLTMWSANLDWSGFSERMILNGMPPGKWQYDKTKRTMEYEESDEPIRTGPSTTQFIFGHPEFDKDGNVTGMTTPKVQFREPINVETFKTTLLSTYTNILEECKQSHILLNSEGSPSGISRRESRDDYADDLKQSKTEIDDAGKWLIETVLMFADELMGKNRGEKKYAVSFSSTIKTGALSSDEVEAIIKQVDNKLKSVETAMKELGIDDIQSELDKIDSVSEHVSEIVTVMAEMGITSPEFVAEAVEILIQDKIEYFTKAEDGTVINIETVKEQARNSAERSQQESDIINQV